MQCLFCSQSSTEVLSEGPRSRTCRTLITNHDSHGCHHTCATVCYATSHPLLLCRSPQSECITRCLALSLRLGVPIHKLSLDPLWLWNHCKLGSRTHPIRSVKAVDDTPCVRCSGYGMPRADTPAPPVQFLKGRAFHISMASQTWAKTSRGERMRSGRPAFQAARAITQTAA
jgi:hypothetical protein